MAPTAAPGHALLDDAQLLVRLRRRDEEAFTFLVETHHGRLLRLARAFVREATIAEEVVQETWLAVVSGIAAFEGRGSLKAWIFSILANRARTRAVREGRSVNFSSLGADDVGELADAALFDAKGYWRADPAPWKALTPVAIALSAELSERLLAAIEALPARQQAVVIMRDLEQVSSDEVCNVLGLSETNQRVLLHRGRVQLRAALEPYMTAGEKRPC